jgi:hypothetical protein
MRTWGWLLKRKGGWRSILVRSSQRSRHLLKILFTFVTAGSANSTLFNSYHPYADHLQFLNDLQSAYRSNSEIAVAGNSDAGRHNTGIHFYGCGGLGSKPAVVTHGGVHAREWISPMVCMILFLPLSRNLTLDFR